MKRTTFILIALSMAVIALPAHAQLGLPKLGGSGSGQSDAPSADAFLQSFQKSNEEVSRAQVHFLKALKLDKDAATLAEETKSLSSGAINSAAIKKRTQLTNSAQAEIDKKISAGATLDAEGKVEYLKGLEALVAGVLSAREVASKASAMASSLGSNPMALAGSGRAALEVAKGAPSYLTSLTGALSNAIKFGEKNGIKSESAMSAMKGL